jgi:hypothetical protein
VAETDVANRMGMGRQRRGRRTQLTPRISADGVAGKQAMVNPDLVALTGAGSRR